MDTIYRPTAYGRFFIVRIRQPAAVKKTKKFAWRRQYPLLDFFYLKPLDRNNPYMDNSTHRSKTHTAEAVIARNADSQSVRWRVSRKDQATGGLQTLFLQFGKQYRPPDSEKGRGAWGSMNKVQTRRVATQKPRNIRTMLGLRVSLL